MTNEPDPALSGAPMNTFFTRLRRLGRFTIAAVALALPAAALAGQGVARMLYTVPNNTFIEKRTGETVVTINDASGSISSVQIALNNARSANPTAVIVVRLTNLTYTVSSAGL